MTREPSTEHTTNAPTEIDVSVAVGPTDVQAARLNASGVSLRMLDMDKDADDAARRQVVTDMREALNAYRDAVRAEAAIEEAQR